MTYCSLDLELSGFDPLKNEILEVGFAFFQPTENGLEITETYSQVFRPKEQVHPKILGLTGISREELAAAPTLNECREFLQSKIGDAILVGHNISVDARFLEASGFKLSGQSIDTLDLVQFLLPTHHSYNLENLMHYFQVDHKEAHRALADAKATISVLQRLLGLYNNFSPELRELMQGLIGRHRFIWTELFDFQFQLPAEPAEEVTAALAKPVEQRNPTVALPKAGTVVVQPFGQRTVESTARLLEGSSDHLLVVPDKQTVLSLWRGGLVHGVFSADDLFNREKLDQLITIASTPEEIIFCLKILVWLYTNWQTETLVDLNFSFFGGQFRSLVAGGTIQESANSSLLAADYATFERLSQLKYYTKRVPVLWTVDQFEHWLNAGNQSRLTWNRALYLLKTIYNPETDWGQKEYKTAILEGLGAVDLYFALAGMLLDKHFASYPYISYEVLSNNSLVFNRLQQAAINLSDRFKKIAQTAPGLDELVDFGNRLESFFAKQDERVKWIELHDTSSVFFNQPLHIEGQVERLFQPYPTPVLVNSQSDDSVLAYMLQRLGLPNPSEIILEPVKSKRVTVLVVNRDPSDEELLAALKVGSLPAVALFQTTTMVKAFYDSHFPALKAEGRVFAQGYSGGSNKILRNFTINKASILLATADFLVRQSRSLAPRTVTINGLPKVNINHPYTKALAGYWTEKFPDFIELQNRQKFYQLLHIVWSPVLDRVLLFADGLDSQWGTQWAQYLSQISHLKLENVDNTGN